MGPGYGEKKIPCGAQFLRPRLIDLPWASKLLNPALSDARMKF